MIDETLAHNIGTFFGLLFGMLFAYLPYILAGLFVIGAIIQLHGVLIQLLFNLRWWSKKDEWFPTKEPKKAKKTKKSKPKTNKNSATVVDTYSEEYKLPQLPFN